MKVKIKIPGLFLLVTQLLILNQLSGIASGYENIRFQSITTQQGLSRALVKAIATDQNGMLWVATENGLNRYDGYEFTVFRHNPVDSSSLPDNNVISLCSAGPSGMIAGMKSGRIARYDFITNRFYTLTFPETLRPALEFAEPDFLLTDENGRLWIASTQGLFVTDLRTGEAWHFNQENSGLKSRYIKHLLIDSQKQLWLATDAGIARVENHLEPAKAVIVSYPAEGFPSNYVKRLIEDKQGRLWAGADGGFCHVDKKEGKPLQNFTHDPANPQSLANNYIKAMALDKHGMIWVGHDLGVSLFDPETSAFISQHASGDNGYGLLNNYVKCLLYDENHIMWVGTDLGISYYDPIKEPFTAFLHQPGKAGTLSGNLVYALFQDAPDSIWVATNNGLNLWNPITNQVSWFKHDPDDRLSLSSNVVRAVVRDKKGRLWVGTDNGLNQMVRFHNRDVFRHIDASAANNQGLNNIFVVTMRACSDGQLWVGTWGGGVNVFNPETNRFTYLTENNADSTKRINNNQIANIFEDSKRQVWLRSGNIIDLNTGRVKPFPFGQQLSNINFFYEDRTGRIWIGTSSNGLAIYEPESGELNQLNQYRLLHEGVVVSMLQSAEGDFWIAVDKQIARLSEDLSKLEVFDASDGLQDGDFSNEAALSGQDGWMYFAGNKGITRFRPNEINLNDREVKVYFTGLRLYNQLLEPSIDGPLDTAMISKKQLILPYNHRELVFEFTGINFTNPQKNTYAYRIRGLQTDWTYTDADNRRASYFQLPPGKYTLEVKAANNSGLWNQQPAGLNIVVLQPWYLLWWVQLTGILLLILLVYTIITLRTRNLRKQKLLLEAKVRQRTNELAAQNVQIEEKNKQLEEASKAKSEFLANMSHEIRTPLNGVIGFTDLVLKTELSPTQKEYLQIVTQSAESLLNIINDILDFSKIEAGKLELFFEKCDLQEIGNQSIDMITFQAQQKGLEILLHMPPQLPKFIWTDIVRMKQVLVNLLSNAVKFTEKGEVELKIGIVKMIDPITALFRFSVRDTGIGIKADKMHLIFEAFTQEDSSTTKRFGGTGLGLTISNKLLGMMGSRLQLESEEGNGSLFYFDIPLRFEYGKTDLKDTIGSVSKVLVVDDNNNNRMILREMLAHLNITTIEADGREAALLMLQSHRDIDVVFMDYHMPGTDGLGIVEIIRKTPGLLRSTTPVIMWHSSIDDQRFIDRCERLGISQRMVKPVKQKNLRQVLSNLSPSVKLENRPVINEPRAYADAYEILLVEDNPVNLMLAKSILHKVLPNARLHEAIHGGHAVAFCEHHKPDFIFMDIQMPVMNGFEATRSIRALEGFSKVPMVALTAGNVKGEKEKCFEAGMNDFVTKPVVEQTITETLEKWLQPRQLISQPDRKAAEVRVPELFSMQALKEDLGDDPVFLREFLIVLKESLLRSKADLRHCVETANREGLSAAAHKLKGTAFSINLQTLSQLAYQLEKTEEITDSLAEKLLSDIEENIDQLLPQVEAELITFEPPSD